MMDCILAGIGTSPHVVLELLLLLQTLKQHLCQTTESAVNYPHAIHFACDCRAHHRHCQYAWPASVRCSGKLAGGVTRNFGSPVARSESARAMQHGHNEIDERG